MNINHLNYLVDVAKTKSITLSAKRLFISQQGLSQIILRLENDLKAPLLHRHRQGVTLTAAGEVVVEKAQEILQKYEELLHGVQPYSQVNPQNLSNKLSISVVPFLSINLLPEVLDLFHRQFPAVEIHIQEKQPDDIINEVNNCNVDIGLVILPEYLYKEQIFKCSGTYEKLFENEMFAVVSNHSPLANKKYLSIKVLYQYPIALYNFEPYLNIVSQMFQDSNNLNILVKTNSVELYKKTIINHKAVGITTSMDIRLLNDDSLVTIPLKESIKLFYACFTPSCCPTSPAAEEFIAILKSYVSGKLSHKK